MTQIPINKLLNPINEDTKLPFGAYKGETIKDMLEYKPEYLEWLCDQAFFRLKFKKFYNFVKPCLNDKEDTFLIPNEAEVDVEAED